MYMLNEVRSWRSKTQAKVYIPTFVQIINLDILNELQTINITPLESKSSSAEVKSPELYPEPEGTPPLMPIEPLEQ